jgi:amino acid adenylation domain-containing protein
MSSTSPLDAATRAKLAQLLKAKQTPKQYPMGYGQQRLWFLDQLEPNNIFYNTFRPYRIVGAVDVPALEKALNAILERHAALRTTFTVAEGQPVQVVAPTLYIPLTVMDLPLSGTERGSGGEVVARAHAERAAALPFDLNNGPLVRWELVRLAPEEHWLLLTFHHIVVDGWSLGVLARELKELYSAFRNGTTPALTPLPIQYSDFTRWQTEWLTQSGTLERELTYWQQQLRDVSPLELPTDRPRPAVQRFEGAVHRFALPDDLTQTLRELSKREGVTLFMTLLAGWYTFLYRHTGQEDITIGSPVAGRPRTETEALIGLFINTVVLRTTLANNPTVRALLQQVRHTALEAFQHQDVPFEQVVNAVAPTRALNRSPLFDVMFALQNSPAVPVALEGTEVSPVAVARTIAAYDLTLALTDDGNRLEGLMEFNTDLFDAHTIAAWAERFIIVLRGMVREPNARLNELPILTPVDHALIHQSAHGAEMALPETTIPTLIAQQAEHTPTAPAVIAGETVLTYQELHERACVLAAHLRTKGVERGTVVALFLPRSPKLMVALLAIQYAGATYLPLDPTYPAERITYMLADSGAAWAITDSAHQRDLPSTVQPIVVNRSFDSTNATSPVTAQPEEIAYILYTSGSTGRPKGVRISHRALLNHALAQAEHYDLRPMDKVLQFASISFDVAGEEIYPTWLRGGAVVLRDDSVLDGVEAFHAFITHHQITVLNPPTAFWHDWVAELMATPQPIPATVRLVIAGGEGCSTERLRQWWQMAGRVIRWVNAYGPTEATISATVYEPTTLPTPAIVPIGRPIANMVAYVLDEEMRIVPPGVVGELYLGGVGLAEGYHQRPELTAERFMTIAPEGIPLRLYRTGDRARLLADGTLEFAGRRDDQIKLRGFRIELGEIEAALLRHPAVQNAIVLMLGKETATPFLAAYWVAQAGQSISGSALRTYLASHLPAYMLPTSFTQLPEFPLTPSGKVNRRALPAPDLTTLEPSTPALPDSHSTSPYVELITGVWETLLERTGIHPHANFFELGGHSLLATRVVGRLRTLLNREIPLRLLFEQPTIAGLADCIEQSTHDNALPPLEADSTDTIHPLSFAQERLWFLEQYDPDTATYNIPASLILRGTVDVERLEQALNGLVARHDSLRTTFVLQGGEPMQVVLPPTFIPLPVLNTPPSPLWRGGQGGEVSVHPLSATERGQGGEVWEDEARRFARQPFALEQELPVRWELLAVAPDEHWLLLSFHHAMMDGWSVAIFTRELVALYQGESLPDLPVQYGDYARWQRNRLAEESGLERERAYWQKQLHDLPVVELPTDMPRPAHQSTHGTQTRFHLSATLLEQVEQFSRTVGVTPFMTLLAAYYTLLYRYTGQNDLPIGTPVAGRLHPATESVLGLFVNTVVLRGDLSGVADFRALVERVRGMTLEAFTHQALPFEQVVSAVAPDRSLHHTPLFQTMFVWQGDAGTLPVANEFQLELLDVDTGVARVELTWILSKVNGELRALVEYNRDLFLPDTINRMMEHFQTLLSHALAEPTLPLHALPIIGDVEAATLQQWSKSPVEPLPSLTIAERFEQNAATMPDVVAVVTESETLTYADLNRRANQLARHLRQQGIHREKVVGIALPRSADTVVALLAILKAGGAYLPLDPAYPAERLRYMVETASPVLLMTTSNMAGDFPVQDVPSLTLDTIELSDLDDSNLEIEAAPEQVAYIMFTSGSTGQPKGIAIPQKAILRLTQEQKAFGFKGETWMFLAPLGFDASTIELWGPLLGGGKVALYPDELPSPESIATAIERFGVTSLWLTAGLFHQMVEHHVMGLAPLRRLLAGGDVLSVAAVQKVRHALPHVKMVNGYGPTENTTFTTCYPIPDDALLHHSVPIGYPIDHTDVVILDAHLRRVPMGVAGDLYTGGDGLARGYLNRPGFTAERFIPHPFSDKAGARLYRTGDRARYLPDGAIEFLGRNDNQVKVRGYRIELGEIEMVLGSHPAVENAVTTVRVAPSGDQVLAAYVVGDVTPAEIRAFLQESLPDYMVPTLIVSVAHLPLTPNGKVDRRALPEPTFDVLEATTTLPITETEKQMAVVWEALLGVPIARESHFFHIGGHSLMATRIVARVRELWNVTLPLKTLFEHPTLAEWAAVVDRTVQDSNGEYPVGAHLTIRKTQENGSPLPLSFAQERLWFLDQLTPGDAALNIPVALNLFGTLDVTRLETALARIVARHATLRTTFALVNGQPVQVIEDSLTVPLEIVDAFSPISVAERGGRGGEVFDFIEHPFNLATGPLVRWRLVRVAERHHLLVVVFHHSISDGWSVGKFLREIEQGYQDLPLPPLPIQYSDYARWQREWLASPAAEQELNYWRSQLTPLPPVLDLPTDFPRPAVLSTRGAEQVAWIPESLAQGLREVAQAENSTLFMLLCAAFKVLLARLSGQQDIAVGTPIAGRTQTEVEPLLGIFLNTLVLRSDLTQTPTFRDLLAQVRTTALNGYEHQLIPFEKLLEAFVPERSLSHAPLFQAFFNMLTLEEGLLNLPGITSERYPLRDQHSKFDLTLYAQEREDKIRLTFVYSTDLFGAERMATMAAQYIALLEQIVAAPQQAWTDYSLLPDVHRSILPDPTEALADTWQGPVYHHLARWGHQPAVRGADGSVQTYSDLSTESDAIAKKLYYVGVAPQRVVAIFAARHPALVSTVVGVLKAGAIFTMLDPAYPPARLLHYLEVANPVAFVVLPGADELPDEVQSWLAERTIPILTLPLHHAVNGNGFHAMPTPSLPLSAESRAVLTFTSGSTGLPKGIWGRHGPLTHFYPDMATRFGLNHKDRFAMLSGLAHDPLQRDMFTPLWVGASLAVPDGARLGEPGYLAQWLAEQAVTVVHLTPAMGQLIVEFAGEGMLPALRLAFFVGDKLTWRDVERLRAVAPNVQVVNLYGSTETQRAVSYYVVPHDNRSTAPQKQIVPIGAGFPDVQLLILNEAGQQAGIGELGEIYVRSPHLAEGYHDSALTSARFLPNPFTQASSDRLYRTGDVGRYRPDGQVEGAGRNDRQVKIRGFRIELGEIEAALLRHAGVRQAVVVRYATATTEHLVAYIVPTGETMLDSANLRAYLGQDLPDYMLPALFIPIPRVPLTPNGKLDERALPDPADHFSVATDTDVAPRNEVEEWLVEVWAELLNRDRVSVTANFFALGGHSLLATRLVSRVNAYYELHVPLRAFFEKPTIADLANLIETIIMAEISAMDDAELRAALES